MIFNTKVLSLFFLSSSFLVNALNECDELKTYLNDKVEITECQNDSEGRINLINVNDIGMKEEDFKKLQSYKTITNLSYTLSNGDVKNKDGYPTSIKYLTNLNNLENLEKLYIGYDTYTMNCSPQYSSYPECYTHLTATIENDTLKDLKNLKELSFYRINISQDNVNEISTLNNLKSLYTESSLFDKISNSKALNTLKNMKTFTYRGSVVGESTTYLPMEFINDFKSLKELNVNLYSHFHGAASFLHDKLNLKFSDDSKIEYIYLHGIRVNEAIVDEISKLNNLKELKLETCRFEFEDELINKLKKLGDRCPMKISYEYCEYQESLENVNNKNCESTATTTSSTASSTKKSTTTSTKKTKKTSSTKKSTKTTKKSSTKRSTSKTSKKSSTKRSTSKTSKKSSTKRSTSKKTSIKTIKKIITATKTIRKTVKKH